MTNPTRVKPPFGALAFFAIAMSLGVYFTFAAVQGEYGLFRRAELETTAAALRAERDALDVQVDRMENLTLRLSDAYLDLDLLDQQARDILGLMRQDEIVVR
ncbi:septum formation initiator family protein [Mesobacterium sp. TK19101]|uniref:Septum formation initiator family protein n=1 Tax=Mesobacterium hydrothermale TaxID=3111907 RepID=A0ABU6HM20_9RHOB|nr:septum formation initiator family protein [Mesobacterium sp. TK19101]MEC3862235.1 septum formation initiator family protein [Mesobacterium sp. TK19101]